MPRIFDNIDQSLLPVLRETLSVSDHSDFCVGFFNLRGWRSLDSCIENWSGGEGKQCRLLVGMHRHDEEQLRAALGLSTGPEIDNATAVRLRRRLAESFRNQLTIGVPTNDDEQGLRRLADQIRKQKVVVKLFLRHPLHAKLYLLFRPDPVNPTVGFVGSSNLTMSGLSRQGELNVDVMDHDACDKLAKWFEDRWNDQFCIDISAELVKIIDESWASERLVPPYHVYVKMAYHLSREARDSLRGHDIPSDIGDRLFEFQRRAVKIAAHHLEKRGGVLIGDVVGLGKTLMATAVAKVVQETTYVSTLIICPVNLVPMWESYRDEYGLQAKVVPISRVSSELQHVPARFRLVLIDESHNLRNRQGRRYAAIREYISQSNSKVILLSATPYNKNYIDLSNQLRLFVPEDFDLGIRPEQLIREQGELELLRLQISPRSLAAFERSIHADDWRELMRLYMIRRTRGFIKDNYGELDPVTGRKFLLYSDGRKAFFPDRDPKKVPFKIDDDDPTDQYARLYAPAVVDAINRLELPRYGMALYVAASPSRPHSAEEDAILDDLSRAGKRLMGFCRTNLFKRLESSGQAFIQSIERHILRNYIFLHAVEANIPLPIGTQDMGLLDGSSDDDAEDLFTPATDADNGDEDTPSEPILPPLRTEAEYRAAAAAIYEKYEAKYYRRFRWLRPDVFVADLAAHLKKDADALLKILKRSGPWDPTKDAKLQALVELLSETHPNEKVLIFSQFSDTVRYLSEQIEQEVEKVEGVTGDHSNPTSAAWRFSPVSNNRRARVEPSDELRVLIATDVLSEGQNLQDCHVVVNYDLPWAIIRLIQRAGRVDRIGQEADRILCYSFWPADGVERIINLRNRVRARLRQNAEVVGTDEAFFEDEVSDQAMRDLFTEKSGILDGDDDREVDLASRALEIWKKAIKRDPSLETLIPDMPAVSFATKRFVPPTPRAREGVLVYMRTPMDNDALVWMDRNGEVVTESQREILDAAACEPDEPVRPRHARHHELVGKAVELVAKEDKPVGGQLGKPTGARFRVYERLKAHADSLKGTLYESKALLRAIDDIFRFPLTSHSTDVINREFKSGIGDPKLAELVIAMREEGRLVRATDDDQPTDEPYIICSMGLFNDT